MSNINLPFGGSNGLPSYEVGDTYITVEPFSGTPPTSTTDETLADQGAALAAYSVVGRVTVGAAGAAVAGTNTGNGTVTSISKGKLAQVGTYTILFTGATAYKVISPSGDQLNSASAAGAYTSPEINFTFTAGTTPMVAGDSFTIAVAAGSGNVTLCDPDATDGSQAPIGITTAYASDVNGTQGIAIFRDGTFNPAALNWHASFDTDAKKRLAFEKSAPGIFIKSVLA